ncbi:MAG: Efflux ABC transporter, permease protein, partial [uncultured Thermomicrobiales bacterium]
SSWRSSSRARRCWSRSRSWSGRSGSSRTPSRRRRRCPAGSAPPPPGTRCRRRWSPAAPCSATPAGEGSRGSPSTRCRWRSSGRCWSWRSSSRSRSAATGGSTA